MSAFRTRRLFAAALASLSIVGAAACSGGGTSGASGANAGTSTAAPAPAPETGPVTLRLGYFPNVTHAPAIVGLETGVFAKALGPNVTIKPSTFNAGPAAVEAIFSGALDATFVGPNPAINAWAKSKGEAIKIVSGSTSGGAFFVVKPDITSAADLKGKKVATPQLGNTQDVALRTWLASKGLQTTPQGGGDVSIVPQENAQTLETFKSGQIVGAWVPEPWATRLQAEAGGKVLVDERELWPNGAYITTQLIVSQKFLKEHPATVGALVAGTVDAIDATNADPNAAQQTVNAAIGKLTGKQLPPAVIAAAWKNLTFTPDPLAASLRKNAADAEKLGLLSSVDLKGIYDLSFLNRALGTKSKPAVSE